MKRIVLFPSLICATACGHLDRHSLKMPDREISVVQHDRDAARRRSNSLYLPNRPVKEDEFGTRSLDDFIAGMYRTMNSAMGIGIAANQVGKNIQVFIIEAKPGHPRYRVLGAVPYGVFINPRIVHASAQRRNFWHGCLSAVGEKRGNVATYEWIDIEASAPNAEPIRARLEGLAAVIFQHEFRHMLGGTYLDRAMEYLDKPELDRKFDSGEAKFFEAADERLPLLIGDYQIGETLEDYYARSRTSNR